VKTPGLVTGPGSVLELVLNIEQPDADRRRQNGDRQVHQQEWPDADQADHAGDQYRNGGVRAHRAEPGLPAAAHHPDRQPMAQDEQIARADAEHHHWMPVQTIEHSAPSGPREEFTHGQRVDVAEASLIEISRTCMMERMVVPPVAVRGQRHDADDPADPIVGETVAEKRAMAAIVLDHEKTDKQARGRHRSHEADPAVKVKGHPHQGPNRSEGYGGDRKLEAATHVVRLAKAAEQLNQRAGFRPANRIFLHCSATSTDVVQLAARSGVLGEEWVLVCRPIAFNCRRLLNFRTRIRRVVTSKSPGRAVDCVAIRSGGQRTLHACTECQNGKSHLHLIFLFMSDGPSDIRDRSILSTRGSP